MSEHKCPRCGGLPGGCICGGTTAGERRQGERRKARGTPPFLRPDEALTGDVLNGCFRATQRRQREGVPGYKDFTYTVEPVGGAPQVAGEPVAYMMTSASGDVQPAILILTTEAPDAE